MCPWTCVLTDSSTHADRLTCMIITTVSLKGGTGKTTSTIFLAAALKARGANVLVVDNDEQGDAYSWATQLGWDTVSLDYIDNIFSRQDLINQYDHVLIDAPPGNVDRTAFLIEQSDLVLIPTQPTASDISQVGEIAGLIQGIRQYTPTDAHLLLTRVLKGTRAQAQVRDALSGYELDILETEIPQRQAIAMSYGSEPTSPALDYYVALVTELSERYDLD